MTEAEQQVMGLIASAGDSRGKAFMALQAARKHDYQTAHQLMKDAVEADVDAHNIQTKLIQQSLSEGGEAPEINLLMVHAQDHYMTAQLARDLIEEMITILEDRDNAGE